MSKEKTTPLDGPLGIFFYGAILLLIGAPWEANLRMIAARSTWRSPPSSRTRAT